MESQARCSVEHTDRITEADPSTVPDDRAGDRRLQWVRQTVRRGRDSPYAMLRTLSEEEVAWLLAPLLSLLDDLDEQVREGQHTVLLPADRQLSVRDTRTSRP